MQGAAADSVYRLPSANSQEHNQEDPFTHIATTENRYTSPDALTFPPITPPQSTEDTSLPFEWSERTTHKRGHRRTRRSTQAAEGLREGDHNSKSRTKRYG
jgi:hypothetical protein